VCSGSFVTLEYFYILFVMCSACFYVQVQRLAQTKEIQLERRRERIATAVAQITSMCDEAKALVDSGKTARVVEGAEAMKTKAETALKTAAAYRDSTTGETVGFPNFNTFNLLSDFEIFRRKCRCLIIIIMGL